MTDNELSETVTSDERLARFILQRSHLRQDGRSSRMRLFPILGQICR